MRSASVSQDDGPSIDEATRRLFDDLTRQSRHREFIARIDGRRRELAGPPPSLEARFVVAPGAFYKEFPHTGADGRLFSEAARAIGCRTDLIPVASTGGLEGNAALIRDWLAAQPDEPIVLASISKGGPDVKLALSLAGADEAFRNVVAWINVGGMLSGSPMVDFVLERPLKRAFYRLLFWWRGYNFRAIADLARRPGGLLDFNLAAPSGLRMIHVIGFPLKEHLTHRLTRTCHARIAPLGPNDGAVLLEDVCKLPGEIYPVLGADHYLRPAWELKTLAYAILEELADKGEREEGREEREECESPCPLLPPSPLPVFP